MKSERLVKRFARTILRRYPEDIFIAIQRPGACNTRKTSGIPRLIWVAKQRQRYDVVRQRLSAEPINRSHQEQVQRTEAGKQLPDLCAVIFKREIEDDRQWRVGLQPAQPERISRMTDIAGHFDRTWHRLMRFCDGVDKPYRRLARGQRLAPFRLAMANIVKQRIHARRHDIGIDLHIMPCVKLGAGITLEKKTEAHEMLDRGDVHQARVREGLHIPVGIEQPRLFDFAGQIIKSQHYQPSWNRAAPDMEPDIGNRFSAAFPGGRLRSGANPPSCD